MGGLGAFLSIFLLVKSTDIDAPAGKWLLVVESTLRIFVGVVVAAIVGCAVSAGAPIGTKLLVGLLSGASAPALFTLTKKLVGISPRRTSGRTT